jgi:hypothetical protein
VTLREKIPFMEPNEITAQVVDAAYKTRAPRRDGITRIVNGLPEPPNPNEEIE